MYSTLCTITSDTSQLCKTLTLKRGLQGQWYYRLDYDIILSFGLTELKAQTAWLENVSESITFPATHVVTVSTGRRKEVRWNASTWYTLRRPHHEHDCHRSPAEIIYDMEVAEED